MTAKRTVAACVGALTVAAIVRWPARPTAQQEPQQRGDATPFAEMKWRPIGPFRGGRSKAITGVRGQPSVFMNLLQGADVAPTSQLVSAATERRAALNTLLARWTALKAEASALSR
jgi:hypothetical protein